MSEAKGEKKLKLNFAQDHSLEFSWQDKDNKIQTSVGVNALAEFYYRAFYRYIEVPDRASILRQARLADLIIKVDDKNPTIEITESDLKFLLDEYEKVFKPGAEGPSKFKFSNMDVKLLAALEKMWEEAGGKPETPTPDA